MNFKLVYYLTSFLFPKTEEKKALEQTCLKLQAERDVLKSRKIYKKTVQRLRNKKEKIRVGFILSENSKWGYQSLYDLFANSEHYEPVVLITLLTSVHKGVDTTRYNSQENYDFFKSRDMNVEYLYQDGKYKNLKDFKLDIVFYDQPWDLPEKYRPSALYKYALPCFCSYSYEVLHDTDNYFTNFHAFLFRYFIEHEINYKRYKKYNKFAEDNCVVAGYPKLDVYLDKNDSECSVCKDKNKFKIIYAPHHSFDNALKLSTFIENHNDILELAKNNPDTTWIFKPHPRLKFALMKMKVMSEEEIDNYYKEWEKVGKVYTQGDYFDIFKTSDLMITDCCSFLAEYLPTEKPLIRLINNKAQPLNFLGDKIVSQYYYAHNKQDLEIIFEQLKNGNDYKKEERIKLIPDIVDPTTPAAVKIFNYFEELLYS